MKTRSTLFLILAGLLLITSACSTATDPAPTSTPPTQAPTQAASQSDTPAATTEAMKPNDSVRPFVPAQGDSVVNVSNDWFTTAGNCMVCHRNNLDQAGIDISFGEIWRGTMMANSAKDPYYLATVSNEAAQFPELAAAIENICSSCHMPMAHFSDTAAGQSGVIFNEGGYLDPLHALNPMALDGVSCTTCHQLQDTDLGEFSSFSGGMVFDQTTLPGDRILFGPFVPSQQGINLMRSSSGYKIEQGLHLQESDMCATCHNLYTHYIDESGGLSDDLFPEQTPYSEWLNSDFSQSTACQACHMPPAEGEVTLSSMGPAIPRAPVSKHVLDGGNIYMLDILKNFGGELGVTAGTDHFDATMQRTLTQLQTGTATLAISEPALEGTSLNFDVVLNVLTGHKFPTSYPSRRAWIHVTVKDSAGNLVFESGSVGQDGAISGNDNDSDPLTFEPHYDLISLPDQVQIYEPILQDVKGSVTTELLMAAAYGKDNRLLPLGFDKSAVPDDIAVYGAAVLDDDFLAGTDTVTYQIDTNGSTGPYTIEVELLYQSIGYRWAQNTIAHGTQQADLFGDYYRAIPNLPSVIAVQSIEFK